MWTRKELKTRAKNVLRTSYWKALLVSIVIAIVGGDNGGTYNTGRHSDDVRNIVSSPNSSFYPEYIFAFIGMIIFFVVVAVGVRIFLGYPLEVGGRRYFTRSAEGDVDMNYLGYAFRNKRYISIIKAMLYKGVLIFLWSLLLIIPGIIKAYAYRMVPYLLGDNPQLDYKRAVELSNQMTDGEKFDMFVLDLSFIGWYILGALALGIGVIFVMPYDNATFGELYLVLRQKALDMGLCTHEELNLPGSNEL